MVSGAVLVEDSFGRVFADTLYAVQRGSWQAQKGAAYVLEETSREIFVFQGQTKKALVSDLESAKETSKKLSGEAGNILGISLQIPPETVSLFGEYFKWLGSVVKLAVLDQVEKQAFYGGRGAREIVSDISYEISNTKIQLPELPEVLTMPVIRMPRFALMVPEIPDPERVIALPKIEVPKVDLPRLAMPEVPYVEFLSIALQKSRTYFSTGLNEISKNLSISIQRTGSYAEKTSLITGRIGGNLFGSLADRVDRGWDNLVYEFKTEKERIFHAAAPASLKEGCEGSSFLRSLLRLLRNFKMLYTKTISVFYQFW